MSVCWTPYYLTRIYACFSKSEIYTYKKWAFLIHLRGCRKRPVTKISHAHTYRGRLQTYSICYIKTSYISKKPNKSQTRIIICICNRNRPQQTHTCAALAGATLKLRCKGTTKFSILQEIGGGKRHFRQFFHTLSQK